MSNSLDGVVLAMFLAFASAPGAQAADTVTVSKRMCQKLVAHVPQADVAYKPGVDVYGRAVVGADLNDYASFVPQEVEIPITVDLFDRMGMAPPPGVGAKPTVGVLRYSGGRFSYNGQPLQNGGEQVFADACRDAGYR